MFSLLCSRKGQDARQVPSEMFISLTFPVQSLTSFLFLVGLSRSCGLQGHSAIQAKAGLIELLSLLCPSRGQDVLQDLNEMIISFAFSVETLTIFQYLVDSFKPCDSQGHVVEQAEAGHFELFSLLCPRRG